MNADISESIKVSFSRLPCTARRPTAGFHFVVMSTILHLYFRFDDEGEMKTYVSPITQLRVSYLPKGNIVHTTPTAPVADFDMGFGIPWWRDSNYRVGHLTAQIRVIRLRNMLTGQEDHMEVPSEETLGEIRERYLEINWHAKSYTWKALHNAGDDAPDFRELDMNRTLLQNGVEDESPVFQDHNLPHDYHVPVLQLYWNDDLTVA